MSRLNLNRFPSMVQWKSNQVCFIMDNGRMDLDMVEESNFGLMVLFMKDIGFKTKLMVMVD